MKTFRVLGVAFALLLVLALAVVPAYAQSGSGGSNGGGSNSSSSGGSNGSSSGSNNGATTGGNNGSNGASNASGGGACITNQANGGNFTGVNNWQTLCGQPAVFTFGYDGSNTPVTIEMATDPANSASFFVFTQQEFNKGVNGANPGNAGGHSGAAGFSSTAGTPIGAGTQQVFGTANANGTNNFRNNGNLNWTMSSAFRNGFYVYVQPRTSQNSRFWINMTGAASGGLSFVPNALSGQQGVTTGNSNASGNAGTTSNSGTTANAGTTSGTTANTGTGGTTGNTGSNGSTGNGGGTSGNGNAGGPPRTLPRTGGEFEAMQLLAAGAALVSAGLFVRRRK